MERIINKTPHNVNIVNESGKVIKVFEKSESIIRLSMKIVPDISIDGTPTTKTTFGNPNELPKFKKEIFYIVSQLIKNSFPERTDFLVPAEIVRNENNQIIGCKSLGR